MALCFITIPVREAAVRVGDHVASLYESRHVAIFIAVPNVAANYSRLQDPLTHSPIHFFNLYRECLRLSRPARSSFAQPAANP